MKNLIMLLSLLFLSNCTPVILGASATGGVVAAQERSVGNAVDDLTITTKIKSAYLQTNFDNLFASVHVKSTEGRVLLTGKVPDQQYRIEAVRIAWSQNGVKEVINEIKVEQKTGELAIKQFTIDSWITAQLKTKLLLLKEVRSINYNVETIDSVLYLMGIAQNQEELDQVLRVASTINYVKKVVSYVRIKDMPIKNVNQD